MNSTKISNLSSYNELEQYTEFMVAYYINNSALWVLAVVGLICNTLAFLTIYMIRPFTNASFYVAILAILDTLVLVLKLIYQQLTAYDVPIGDLGCSVTSFMGNFVLHFSTWTLVTMTVERFVAVWFPLRVMRVFTMFRAKLSISIIGLCLVVLNMHYLFTYQIYVDPNPKVNLECKSRPEYEHFEKHVWYWVNSCVYAFIPCSALIVLNALIIYGMRLSFKIQKQMTNSENKSNSKSNQQRQITIMLVTVSIAFVCFLLPVCIFYLVSMHQLPKRSLRDTARFFLTKELVLLTAELNHAVNFFFYFFSSRKFRSMLIKLITLGFRKREENYKMSSTNKQMSMYTSLQKL